MAQQTNGKADAGDDEQALLVFIKLDDEEFGSTDQEEDCFQLEDALMQAVERSDAGEYDGNEIGEGFFTLYMYGPTADRLWEVAAPVVKGAHVPHGSYAAKRYGKPGAKEERIPLP